MVAKLWRTLFGPKRPSAGPAREETPYWMDQEEWREAFQDASLVANGPRQVEEARERIVGRLVRVYESHERLHRQHAALLEGIVRVLDFCAGLHPAPPELEALQGQLLALLTGQGLVPWSPAVGQPVPEGCEVVGAIPSEEYPPGSVGRVVAPGYRWQEGLLFRPARVLMTAEVQRQEAPAPAEPVAVGHSEGQGEEGPLPGKASNE